MKKLFSSGILLFKKHRNHHIIRVMRLTTCLLLLFTCFAFAENTHSQNARVNLNKRHAVLNEVLEDIERQTDYLFISNREIDLEQKVSVTAKNMPVREVLDRILEKTDLSYAMEGVNIVLSKKQVTEEVQQQRKPITGTIQDEKGESVIGANVTIKGSTKGTITDIDGHFSLDADPKDVILVTYIGYIPQEITVGSKSNLRITLREDLKTLDEIVVVGYGTTKKASLTASVASMKGQETAQKPVTNISQNLVGRMPGIVAHQGSGELGYDNPDIFIRGKGTTGSSNALVVIDGVPRENYGQLDPTTIESITILKDAAAVAPYGIGGANGVILITTKKGKEGKPTLSYNGYVGFQNPTRIPEMVNSYEYATLLNEGARNSGLTNMPYSDDQIGMFKKTVDGASDADPDRYPNSRGIRDIIQRNTIMTSHNVELTGGSEYVNYYISLAYTAQDGMFKGTDMKRYNVSSRLDVKATQTTDVSLSLSGYVADHNFPGEAAGSIAYAAVRQPATEAIWYSNGLWGNYLGRSPVALGSNLGGYTKEERTQLYTTLSVEQQLPFIEGLSIKGVVSYDPYKLFKKEWRKPRLSYTPDFSTTPYTFNETTEGDHSLYQRDEDDKRFTFQGYVNYQHRFNDLHDITFLGVAESRKRAKRWFDAKRIGYPIEIDEIDRGSTAAGKVSNSGSSEQETSVGFLYRIGYTYNNRYMIETAGRYDGNYYFAPGKKWGFFPSVSAGWNISEENFMKNNFRNLEMLKIRASYGESGNLAGNAFQYMSGYSMSANSAYFGDPTTGVYEMKQSNPFITWERAKKFDVGIDGVLWRGLLSFSVDYFYDKRDNMLYTPAATVPLEYGIELPQVNGGKMSNQGIELMLSSTHTFPNKMQLDLSGNFTYVHNKLLEMYETSSTYNNPNRRQTGRSYETQFGYKSLGYYTVDDFNADGSLKEGVASIRDARVQPGDIKYADLYGPDGVPDGVIDSYDNTVIGRPKNSPQIIYGFSPTLSWKGFDLNMLFQGAAMNDLYLEGTMAHPFESQGSATKLQYKDHWTPENTNATYPRVYNAPVEHNKVTSSHWMRNAAYLRLKSLEFGYTLPKQITEKASMSRVRIYFAGQNLLTWTPFMDEKVDPEMGNGDGRYYYQQQAFSFGLNVTFK